MRPTPAKTFYDRYMVLILTYATLATVDELFRYKSQGFKLEPFPGYTPDQWGIKAHNRPWIEEAGNFSKGQRIIEVGGAYSLLVKYLSEKYDLEAWIGDDFGTAAGEFDVWNRWGNPYDLPAKHPSVKYVFEPLGVYSPQYPAEYFDRVFSVSTLEHILSEHRLDVFKDMHRCLKPGGVELHTIDIGIPSFEQLFPRAVTDMLPIAGLLIGKARSQIKRWIKIIEDSGVRIAASIPDAISLLDRRILVESPDVVFRFHPPNDKPKPYNPAASLLLIVEDR